MAKYEANIGLEIHAELKTKTKMFCNSLNNPDERHPNVNICPVCTGQPGTLPVINEEAVNQALKVGLALQSKAAEVTKWDRKNYFYPDLPKGYQISQYDSPLCLGGKLTIPGTGKEIKIRRIHLEEDTGRLLHEGHVGHSLVDFNRAGIPLMELVTEPDLKSGEEASAFSQELRLFLKYLGVSDANLEKGEMRIEANLSLKPVSAKGLGTKVEIKNLNSFKAVREAIDFEIKRQAELLDSGKKVVQETRGWDDAKNATFSQREKEESHDYRYFPEPDLPPLSIDGERLNLLRSALSELPPQKRNRFKTQYGLNGEQINILANDRKLADFFENAVSEFMAWEKVGLDKDSLLYDGLDAGPHPVTEEKQELINLTANYLLTDLAGLLNKASAEIDDIRITAEDFAEFTALIHRKIITSKAGKEVLLEMWQTGADPSLIIRRKNLIKADDLAELETALQNVISENSKAVFDYKKGKKESLQFLIGQAAKKTGGRFEPAVISDLLQKLLK